MTPEGRVKRKAVAELQKLGTVHLLPCNRGIWAFRSP